MKPIKLIMSAFGPYANEVIVDFQKLKGSGIFLITGDTGAGKTTIFDGICYALYGEASGGEKRRSVKGFRSDYAASDVPTFVELTFTHKQKTYKIRRNPEYMRAAKRGNGNKETKQLSSVSFSCEEEFEYTKESQVREKVEEIIGLTKEQFWQTVMIAQGDFLKIIKSSTDERKNLFSKLFHTSDYSNLEKIVKSDATKLEQKKIDSLKSIIDYINRINNPIEYTNNKALEELINSNYNKIDNYNAIVNNLNNIKLEFDNSLKEFNKELKEKEQESEQKLTNLTNAKTINDSIKSYNQNKQKLEELQQRQTEIANKQDLYNKINQALVEISPLINDIKSQEKDINIYKTSVNDLQNDLKKYNNNLEDLNKNKETIINNYNNISSLRNEIKNLTDTNKLLKDYKDTFNNHEKEKNKLIKLETQVSQSDQLYNSYKNNFYLNQAGILAKDLEEGIPCPVCGSTNHPNLAVLNTNNNFTKDELDNIEKVNKKLNSDFSAQSTTVKTLKENLETIKNKLVDKVDVNSLNIDNEILKIESDINNINNNINIYENTYSKFNKEYSSLTTKIEELKKNIDSTTNTLNTKEQQLNESKNCLSEKVKQLNYSSLSEVENLLNQKNNLNNLNKEITDYQSNVSSLTGSIKELEKTVKGKEISDIHSLNEDYEKSKKLLEELRNKINKYNNVIKNNDMIIEPLKASILEYDKAVQNHKLINDINICLNGQITGNVRISFETYVLQYYFKKVIGKANLRFNSLSNGNYTLRCKNTAKNLSSQAGLDLEVYSKDTGKWRDVSTLSGGESFIASLCLALGLSDYVQESSAIVRLDSMFIDEGFGTLDDNFLKDAMNTLSKLADGNRLIGIISHVNELKSRIDNQIIITKNNNGSTINIKTE